MPETPETADEIQAIRFKLESIEGTQYLLLRERATEIREGIMRDVFDKYPNAKEVYLAINGRRTQAEIVKYLGSIGVSISQPTVSRMINLMEQEGLVEKVGFGERGGIILGRKRVIDDILKLGRYLEGRGLNDSKNDRHSK